MGPPEGKGVDPRMKLGNSGEEESRYRKRNTSRIKEKEKNMPKVSCVKGGGH